MDAKENKLTKAQLHSIMEGLIFTSGEEGVSLLQLQSVLKDFSKEELKEELQKMEEACLEEERGIVLTNYGGRYRYLAKEHVNEYAKSLYARTSMSFLSPSALETLALVAYRQPITRVEIDEIRGVASDLMLRKLCARGLVETCGRKDVAGRPLLYQVTPQFLDTFGLESLQDLPEVEQPQIKDTLFSESED
jgi:segregation and condensation protein B